MADLKISELTSATTPLGGSEVIPVLQGGANRKTTAQAVAALAAPTDLTYNAATRVLASSTGTDAPLPLATTTDAGLQSAADKTKLDSITVDSATVVRKLVRNNSGVAIAKGQPVYQTGSSGTTITVALADASTEATAAQTLGLAQEAIGDNATGWVIAVGELSGVNTATLTEGQIVWLSETTGGLTTTRPTQPAHGVVLGYCVKQGSGTSGILYVKVDNGLELNELHDVLIGSPTAGQVLRRAADGLWKNAALAAADLPSTAVSPATYGSASQVAQFTVDQQGRLTFAGNVNISIASTAINDSTAAGRALLTGADAAAQRTSLGAAASGAIGSSGLTMATARLLGRSTAGTGAPEEITLPTGFDLSGGALRAPCEIGLACSDETTNLTTGTAKITFRMPYAMTLTAVRLNVNTAPTGSALIVDVNEGGVSVFSTNPRIDIGSKTSVGSATPAVISDAALADDAEITIDLDQIGSTIAGKGLKVWLIGRRA